MESKEVKGITSWGEEHGGSFSSFLTKLTLTRLTREDGGNFYKRLKG